MRGIINSMCDTDLYKLTMQQVVLHHFPAVEVEYEFKMRNYPNGTLDSIKDKIDEELDALCELRFTDKELDYLRTLRFFKPDYIEFLRIFQLNRDYIKTWISDKDEGPYKKGEFRITIKGPMAFYHTFRDPCTCNRE